MLRILGSVKLKILLMSVAAVVACVAIVFIGQSAGAVSRVAPDPADNPGAGNRARLLVAKNGLGNGLHAPESSVIVYMSAPTRTITIENGRDRCGNPKPDSNVAAPTQFTFYRGATPAPMTLMTTPTMAQLNSNQLSCGSDSFSITNNNSVTIGNRTFYPIFIRAEHTGTVGGVNSFRIRSSNQNDVVSYFSQSGTEFALQDRMSVNTSSSDFILRFGTDCTITQPITKPMRWFDDDFGVPGMNGPEFGAELYEITPGGNRSRVLNKNQFTYTGNNQPGSRSYTFKPNHKYEWIWRDVRKINGIQFEIPFDSVFWNVTCAPAPDPEPEPDPGGPGSGNAAGCTPMMVGVQPGSDPDGTIPVRVTTPIRNLGVHSSNQNINVTQDHTTGMSITVTFRETRQHISGYTPVRDNPDFPDLITGWNPVFSGPREWTSSIGPCYNYQLNPGVSSNVGRVVEADAQFNVSSFVDTSRIDTSLTGGHRSQATQWQLTEITVQPGASPPNSAGGNSAVAPCGNYFRNNPTATCTTASNGNRTFNSSPVRTNLPNYPATVPDIAVGSQICYGLSVQPRAHNSNQWRHSSLFCVIVGKKPKVQVHGGDVSIGGEIQTSISTKSGRTYGSWVEYGAMSSGVNSGFASASGLNPDSTSTNQSAWSHLTFANQGGYGSFPNRGAAPPIKEAFTTTSGGTGILNGGTLNNPAQAIVIRNTGTVTIRGDIRYPDQVTFNTMPQLIIIAGNINIQSNVRNIDAWLIADNTINTCSNGPTLLTADDCDNELRINGPVVAESLLLRRTAGSGTGAASNDPAETFNLRADAYLWAYRNATQTTRAQTVFSTELPPRF